MPIGSYGLIFSASIEIFVNDQSMYGFKVFRNTYGRNSHQTTVQLQQWPHLKPQFHLQVCPVTMELALPMYVVVATNILKLFCCLGVSAAMG